MTDIMPFLYGFAAVCGVISAGVLGWAIGNKNNEARLRRLFFKENLGVAEVVGDGLQSREYIVNMSDSLAMFPNEQKLIRIETRDKKGEARFCIRDGVPRLLYNKNKAVPLELNSEVRTIWVCPKCEREVENPDEYINKEKNPICPWSCEDEEGGIVKLESKEVLSSTATTKVGNVEAEQEHLFTIFGMIYGIALAKAKKGIEKYLKAMDWIKWLVIGIGLAVLILLYMTYQNNQLLAELVASLKPAAVAAAQNVTKP